MCRLPTALWTIPAPLREEVYRRLEYLTAGIVAYCERRRVRYYDFVAGAERERSTLGLLPDCFHKDRASTELEARLVSDHVLHELGIKPASANLET